METNNLYIFVLHVEIYADAVRAVNLWILLFNKHLDDRFCRKANETQTQRKEDDKSAEASGFWFLCEFIEDEKHI